MKCPLGHIAIEVAEVRVLVYRFEQRRPAVMLRKLVGERALTGTDVAGDGDVFYLFQGGKITGKRASLGVFYDESSFSFFVSTVLFGVQ